MKYACLVTNQCCIQDLFKRTQEELCCHSYHLWRWTTRRWRTHSPSEEHENNVQ